MSFGTDDRKPDEYFDDFETELTSLDEIESEIDSDIEQEEGFQDCWLEPEEELNFE